MAETGIWNKEALTSLEKDLQNALNTTSKFGPSTKLTDLSKGKGLISEVGLLDVEWTPQQDGLADSFAIKLSVPKQRKEVSGNQLGELLREEARADEDAAQEKLVKYHNSEVLIFDKMKNEPAVVIPKTIYTQSRTLDTVGKIIMEHISGCTSLHMCDNMPRHAVSQVLEALAIFHSMSNKFSEEEKKQMSKQIFKEVYIIMFSPQTLDGLKGMIEEFAKCQNSSGTYSVEEFSKIIGEFSDPKVMDYIDSTAEALSCQRVLTHGDVWMCNMLWHIENRTSENVAEIEEQKWSFKGLIDYQAAHFGCVSNDLIRFFTGCISGKERRENWEKYSEEYYGYLRKYWRGEMPFTLEQLKEGYRRMFPLTAFIVAGSIGAVGNMILGQREGYEKKVATDILCEKQRCILEDIVYYHHRNKKNMDQ